MISQQESRFIAIASEFLGHYSHQYRRYDPFVGEVANLVMQRRDDLGARTPRRPRPRPLDTTLHYMPCDALQWLPWPGSYWPRPEELDAARENWRDFAIWHLPHRRTLRFRALRWPDGTVWDAVAGVSIKSPTEPVFASAPI